MRRFDSRQLDLFQPIGNVAAFPLDRRASLKRAIATELLTVPAKPDRDRLWRKRIKRLMAELQALGLSDVEISNQIWALRTAVGCEARRQVHLKIMRGAG